MKVLCQSLDATSALSRSLAVLPRDVLIIVDIAVNRDFNSHVAIGGALLLHAQVGGIYSSSASTISVCTNTIYVGFSH